MKLNLKQLFDNPRISYIALNITLSGLSFVRSFISIKYLDFFDLGLVGIVQMLMMIMSMLQLGIVSGGYKLFSVYSHNENINNTVSTYIVGMMAVSLPVMLTVLMVEGTSIWIVLFGVMVGALSLYNNWLNCMMLARGDYKQLNRYNLASALGSFLTLPAIYFWKLYGVLLGTAITPVIFFLMALSSMEYLRPKKFRVRWAMFCLLLYYGFVPYLTSTFYLINVQIERWAIVRILSVEELGRLSLCLIISAAFMIVPTSISNLYFPSAMKAYASGDNKTFKSIMKRYAILILGYGALFVTVTALTVHLLVPVFYPKHIPQIPLVYWMLPSLFFTGASTILTIIFNVTFKYRAIITVNVVSVLSMIGGIVFILHSGFRKLQYFVALESIVATVTFLTALTMFLIIRRYIYRLPGIPKTSSISSKI